MTCDPGWTSLFNECYPTTVIGLILVVGGWAFGWFSRLHFNNRSRKLDKVEKRKEYEREAIEAALEWIDPMFTASISVVNLVPSYLLGGFDLIYINQRWPHNLSSELECYEVPTKLRNYLPEGTIQRSINILDLFKFLYDDMIQVDRSNRKDIWDCLLASQNIQTEINNFRGALQKAHADTLK